MPFRGLARPSLVVSALSLRPWRRSILPRFRLRRRPFLGCRPGRSRAVLWRGPIPGRPDLRCGPRPRRRSGRWPIPGRPRPYRLDRRPPVGWTIITRRTIIARRPIPRPVYRTVIARAGPRAIDGCGRTVIGWAITPVAAVPRASVIDYRPRPIPDMRWSIATPQPPHGPRL